MRRPSAPAEPEVGEWRASASGEALGYFDRGAGYSGAYEVAVEFAEDDHADGGFDAGDAQNGGRHALGAGLEFAGGDDEGAVGADRPPWSWLHRFRYLEVPCSVATLSRSGLESPHSSSQRSRS